MIVALFSLPSCERPDKTLADHAMNKSLRFSHKILLAASLIVILAFSLFTLYNDYLQRNAIRADRELSG